jgi:hypothetical protein
MAAHVPERPSLVRGRIGVKALAVGALAILVGTLVVDAGETPPWEVWHDLHELGRIEGGRQVLLRSSFAPDGDRFDRHSPDDQRFIRVDDGEGVIFETTGPGAITRIWMTSGSGISQPLDPDTRIRIYLDGSLTPEVDLPLPALFDGSTPPFTPPLAFDRTTSSGGNLTVVPIPYATGCRITISGEEPDTLWFHVTHHQLPTGTPVATFTGSEDLTAWRALLDGAGGDPWPEPPPWAPEPSTHTVQLSPGGSASVPLPEGPDTVTGLWIAADGAALDHVVMEWRFDGRTTVDLSLRDFFWQGPDGGVAPATVFTSTDDTGRLCSFWPMPYRYTAELVLHHRGAGGAPAHDVDVTVRTSGRAPVAGAGAFTAIASHQDPTDPATEFVMLEQAGRGRIVGLYLDLQSVNTDQRHFLEGDAKLHLNGMVAPTWHGTGVEDTFGGGFYFDQGPFARPLHGAIHADRPVGAEIASSAYRLFLIDSPLYCNGARWTLENGPGPPTGHFPMRARALVFAYTRPATACGPTDTLVLGDAASLSDHAFLADPEATPVTLTSVFNDGASTSLTAAGLVQDQPGVWRFSMTAPTNPRHLAIRRLSDAGRPDEGALLCLNGEEIGVWPRQPEHGDRRWREEDLVLPDGLSGVLDLAIQVQPNLRDVADAPLFNAFRLELHAHGDDIFGDGFESGSTAAWVTDGEGPPSVPASANRR